MSSIFLHPPAIVEKVPVFIFDPSEGIIVAVPVPASNTPVVVEALPVLILIDI